MSIIKPFRGYIPLPDMASKISSPPYDVLSSDEARKMVENNPNSFLRIIKPEIDFDYNIKLSNDSIHKRGLDNLQSLINNKHLVQDEFLSIYIYEIKMDKHIQTGIIAAVSVSEYDNNIIKKHEFTRSEKEDDRTRHIEIINANTGPVFLTFKNDGKFQTITKIGRKENPYISFTAEDRTIHTLWKIKSPTIISKLIKYFETIQYLYIADGHHRAASASRVQKIKSKKQVLQKGNEAYNYFLSVIFPHDEMQILSYNRVVKDLNGLTESDFLQSLKSNFIITPISKNPKTPKTKSIFSMLLNNKCYYLKIKKGFQSNDPIEGLDASILQNYLLNPILGIEDPRTSTRIDFIGGIRGLKELKNRCSLDSKVAFALYPVSIEELMKVADSGKIMPPKSTWFEPKLRSGLVVRLLD